MKKFEEEADRLLLNYNEIKKIPTKAILGV